MLLHLHPPPAAPAPPALPWSDGVGEIAEMMLDGTLCEGCGECLPGEAPGHPRRCRECARTWNNPHPDDRVPCKVCGRRVKFIGMKDHVRDAHQQGAKK